MNVFINGKPMKLPESKSLLEILSSLNLNHGHLAVAVNWKVIPRNKFETTHLSEGDEVEIVSPSAGG